MPKPKTVSKSKPKTNKGLVKSAKFKFDKTLLIVTMVVLTVGAGWLWYKGSHAAGYAVGPAVPRNYLCYTPHPAIQQGSTGDCVKYVQWTLKNYAGQNITVDGNYGPATVQAVKNLQAINKLSVTGTMNTITWERLDKLIQPADSGALRSACKNFTVNGVYGYAPFTISKGETHLKASITFKNMGTHSWSNPSSFISVYNTSGQFVAQYGLTDYSGVWTSPGHTITTTYDNAIYFPNSPGQYEIVAQVSPDFAGGWFGAECRAPFFVTN